MMAAFMAATATRAIREVTSPALHSQRRSMAKARPLKRQATPWCLTYPCGSRLPIRVAQFADGSRLADLAFSTSPICGIRHALFLPCRGPYEEILQPCGTRTTCQTNMACGIEHELREVLRPAVLPKLLCD